MRSIKRVIKGITPRWILGTYGTMKNIIRFLHAKRHAKIEEIKSVAFHSDKETVDLICNHRMSLSRFGDGEFRWMLEKQEQSFQKGSMQLAHQLKEAFQNKNSNLLIGIPIGMFQSSGCKLGTKIWWGIVKWELFSELLVYVDYSRKYCNASITRPYIDYTNREYSRKCFENIKRIWKGRDCLFVEGENTKLGIGNDLFENARSIRRIICPSENAFEKIDQIEDAIREFANKEGCLILGALGPTASILAAHMCQEGYQFIDIGHIDIEYSWFLRKARRREPIPGKYINECRDYAFTEACDSEEYLKSIVKTIC